MAKLASETIAERILKDYIVCGKITDGERLPSIRDLVKVYGPVSRNTIVHALNLLENQGRVQTRHGSGCYVTAGSTRAASGPPPMIGFVSQSTDGEVVLRVHEGISQICRANGMHVLTDSPTRDNYELERSQVQRMVDAGCQALVVYPVTRTLAQMKTDYLATEYSDFPIVLIDVAYPEQKRPRIVFDNFRAGFDMTSLILAAGHKEIAFMDYDKRNRMLMNFSTSERYRGYSHALSLVDMRVKPKNLIQVTWSASHEQIASEVMEVVSQWKDDLDRPTAVIALDDFWAIKIIQMAGKLGISVPDELFVTGFDNLAMAELYYPPFPSTASDFKRMGELAAQMAIDMINGVSSDDTTYMLPVPIVRRDLSDA